MDESKTWVSSRNCRPGTVVDLYEPDGLDVEFVRASGEAQALVSLKTSDVRGVRDEDLVSVWSIARGAA